MVAVVGFDVVHDREPLTAPVLGLPFRLCEIGVLELEVWWQ